MIQIGGILNIFVLYNCLDINECTKGSATCHTNADCTNTDGSYTCMCKAGYTGDGSLCEGRHIAVGSIY